VLFVANKGKETSGLSVRVFNGPFVLRNPSWKGKGSSMKITCLEIKILP